MELMGKLADKDTKNIGMLPSASKDVSIKFVDKCIHIYLFVQPSVSSHNLDIPDTYLTDSIFF